MEKFAVFAAGIAFLCIMASAAQGREASQATQLKVKGTWDFSFGWAGNINFLDQGHDKQRAGGKDAFYARHRIRTQIDFISSEYLSGVVMFEIGTIDWGVSRGNYGRSSGGALDSDGVNIETKRAYLDWLVPGTAIRLRMGLQSLNLPMATGYCSPVMYADVAGISASYAFSDTVSLSFFWARPFDLDGNESESSLSDTMDMLAAVLPISLNGAKLTPWAMYARVGSASGYYNYVINYQGNAFAHSNSEQRGKAHAWWAGAAFELSLFSPLNLKVDAMYGSLGRVELVDDNRRPRPVGTDGWFVDALLEYQLDWARPGILAWWSSGDKANSDNDGAYGRIPVIGVDGCYGPTSFGLGGTAGLGMDGIISPSGVGTWGLGIQLADMQFFEGLSHTVRLAYYQGSNDSAMAKKGRFLPLSAEAVYLTDKDSVIEINFDHRMKIYENLTAILELGYIRLDLDSDTWDAHNTPNKGRVGSHTDDAWKAQLLFRYRF